MFLLWVNLCYFNSNILFQVSCSDWHFLRFLIHNWKNQLLNQQSSFFPITEEFMAVQQWGGTSLGRRLQLSTVIL